MTEHAEAGAGRSRLGEAIERADADAGFRGLVIWYPEKVVEAYGLEGAEASALRTGDMTAVELTDEVRAAASRVFDLHDLHSGE